MAAAQSWEEGEGDEGGQWMLKDRRSDCTGLGALQGAISRLSVNFE
jgi:hypothetical protein